MCVDVSSPGGQTGSLIAASAAALTVGAIGLMVWYSTAVQTAVTVLQVAVRAFIIVGTTGMVAVFAACVWAWWPQPSYKPVQPSYRTPQPVIGSGVAGLIEAGVPVRQKYIQQLEAARDVERSSR